MSITIEVKGARVYFIGNTFSVKDAIKALGGHWDSEKKAWWVGKAKLEAAQKLAAGIASGDVKAVEEDDPRIVAKCRYKGKTYFARWVGRTQSGAEKAHLYSFDGKINFWAAVGGDGNGDTAAVIKRYQPRVDGGREEYQRLSSIRRFVEKLKTETPDEASQRAAIRECGGRCRCSRPTDEGDGTCMICGYAIVG